MYGIAKASFWTAVFVFILLIFVGSNSAQKNIGGLPTLWEDTAINPHDFTNEYYKMNGVNFEMIIGRRTGDDSLSVFSNSSNPFHTNIRVIATFPAYDHNGQLLFWYPLGDLHEMAFGGDKTGMTARELASLNPMYVFPSTRTIDFRAYSSSRQAALLDNAWLATSGRNMNPLGLHEVFVVHFTDLAFTKEGIEMMKFFTKKNGASADDTPIIRTMEDLNYLMKSGFVEATPMKSAGARFTMSPWITEPENGAIARDAFLWMATKDDRPLPAEDSFVWQFHCLQKTGNWCN